MTVIEKLNFDKDLLAKHFAEWAKGPGDIDCDTGHGNHVVSCYDSLRGAYETYHFKQFLAWAYAEYVELKPGDICPNGDVIISLCKDNCMKFNAFNLFSTGWLYHLNVLKEHHQDISKPFATHVRETFGQATGAKSEENWKELIERIDKELKEHDPTDCMNCMFLTDKADMKFYTEYDKTLRTVKVAILNKTYKLDLDYMYEILNMKK